MRYNDNIAFQRNSFGHVKLTQETEGKVMTIPFCSARLGSRKIISSLPDFQSFFRLIFHNSAGCLMLIMSSHSCKFQPYGLKSQGTSSLLDMPIISETLSVLSSLNRTDHLLAHSSKFILCVISH